jgi:hypothetical protein
MPEARDGDPRRQDPVDAVRPSDAGRRRGRLIPLAIVVAFLLIFAFIILVATLNG